MRLNVKVDISAALSKLDKALGAEVVKDVDKITEAYARKMAGEAANDAPVETGLLKNSIASSPKPAPEPHTWQYGSDLPYARRQEYEHKSRKAFIRRSVWNNEEGYRNAVARRVKKGRG